MSLRSWVMTSVTSTEDEVLAEREAVLAFLAEHPKPSGKQLAEAGYVTPHWPKPWGREASPAAQLVIDEQLRAAKVSRPVNPIGIGWAGPTLLAAGTKAQQERWLPDLLSAAAFWCQLFSEPDAGSDLASLRTKAVRDGDEWIIDGVKVWTSYGHVARFGILIARTDPEVDVHRGITYFVCPMDSPGIEISALPDMTGDHAFNQVTFSELRISDDCRIGEVGQGWELAKVTLGNERVSLSGEGALWGRGPTMGDLLERVRASKIQLEASLRDRVTRAYVHAEILKVLRQRTVAAILAGQAPGAEASVRKALADDHGKEVMELGRDLAGPAGMIKGSAPLGALRPGDEIWSWGFLYSPALTIGGGTSEVQRNIIAERVLGLPRELSV